MNKDNEGIVKRYLSLRGSNVTNCSRDGFGYDLSVFLRHIADKPLESITHIDIDGFMQYCTDERKNRSAALSRKYNTLNKFFDTMIAKEYLDMKNPLAKVEKVKLRKKVRGHVALDEYQTIMSMLAAEHDLRALALFSLFFSSGIRISEACQLNRDDLDYENGEFTVIGKGDKERTCVFSAEAGKHVKAYIDSRTDDLIPMFISREHTRLSVSGIRYSVKKATMRAGIVKNITPHLLRHGTAMLLLERGLPLDEIQKVLGHENIGTTQIYAQTSMLRVKKNVNSIYDNVFKEE